MTGRPITFGTSFSLFLAAATAMASGPVESVVTDALLRNDEHTSALWRFNDVEGETVKDLTGNGHDAKLEDGATVVDADWSGRRFGRVVRIERAGRLVTAGGAEDLLTGPFTVDACMRPVRSAGYFFAAGQSRSLLWGLLYRGAGNARLRVPVKYANGEAAFLDTETFEFFRHTGPLSFRRFHHFALTFDGQRTFRVYVDGRLAWTVEAEQDIVAIDLDRPTCAFGQASRWKSAFDGDLAQARVSSVERHFTPAERFLPQTTEEMAPNYRFDMGGADTPVEAGFVGVTPPSRYDAARGFGWDVAPVESNDSWFSAGRYKSDFEGVRATHTEAVRTWRDRDGLTVPDGAMFRLDIPPGRYEVNVVIGQMWKNTRVAGIEANGCRLGDHLRVLEGQGNPLYIATTGHGQGNSVDPEDRTVRGLVTVTGDGLEITFHGFQGRPVSVIAIEAYPWAPVPVKRSGKSLELRWTGEEPAPEGFADAATAFARREFRAASELSREIQDPIVRCVLWAWIIGYPDSTELWHQQLAEEIMATLERHIEERPDDTPAASLLRATRLFYPTLRVQNDQSKGVDELVGSNVWRHRRYGIDHALRILPEEPLYGRSRLLAGSLIHQQVEQNGGMIDPYTFRKPERGQAFPPPIVYLEVARNLYPSSELARIYMGEKVPIKKKIPVPANAPQWAAYQHRALVRVMDVIHYWTDQRQDEHGFFGGGIGDDVETFRWWSIGHLVADDQRTRVGWRALADTAWGYTAGEGYLTHGSDVEHGSEPVGDTHTFLPFIDFGTPRFETSLQRQRVVYERMRDLWTGVNPQGFRMFKSYYYSSREVEPRNGDVPYNLRTANPALFYAWFTRDREVCDLLVDLADSWRDAILAEGQGKPAGIVPLVVTYDEREFCWDRGPWFDPGYYRYPGGGSAKVPNLLLAAYELTGDEKFLEPIRESLRLLRDLRPPRETEDLKPKADLYRALDESKMDIEYAQGSLEWALWIGRSNIGLAGARYRLITGDRQFDDVLAKYGPPTTQFRIAYEQAETPTQREAALTPLLENLKSALDVLDYNIALRTSEPKSTDRIWVGGTETMIGMATGTETVGGARGTERQWPLFGVSWKDTGTDIAALLIANRKDEINGYLYSFANSPKTVGIQFWRLEPGDYVLQLSAADGFQHGDELASKTFQHERPGDAVEVSIPSQRQIWLEIRRVP